MGEAYPHLGQVKNLVFEGGGVKGIAYLGAVERLYGDGPGRLPPEQVQGAGGTSAGAITALVVSLGLDAAAIRKVVGGLDFSRIRQQPTAKDFPHLSTIEKDLLEGVSDLFGGDIWSLYALFHDYGWYDSDWFLGWLRGAIGERLGSDGAESFSAMKQAMERVAGRWIDLRIHATDVTTRATRVLSLATTPDLEVAKAVQMSMSIPFFFQAIAEGGDEFCDGGVIANYPIDLFDSDPGARHFDTLGFHLETPLGEAKGSDSPLDDPPAPDKSCPGRRPVKDLVEYIEGVFESLMVASSEVRALDQDRTVRLSDYCVATTDFGIAQGTADFNGLYNNGYNGTDRFLTDWTPQGVPVVG